MLILKRIENSDGKQKFDVEIQKSLCVGRKIENLIASTSFYLKIIEVLVFYSSFS